MNEPQTNPTASDARSNVPELTLHFWIIKIAPIFAVAVVAQMRTN
jgi:uncharacterized membrane-anchored protein